MLGSRILINVNFYPVLWNQHKKKIVSIFFRHKTIVTVNETLIEKKGIEKKFACQNGNITHNYFLYYIIGLLQ